MSTASGGAAPAWADQVAVVTGGRGDIGGAVVSALLELGVRVASSDVRPADTDPSSDRHREDVVDATDAGAVTDWIASVVDSWGAPTIAVLATGAAGPGRLIDTTPAEWRSVLAVCLDSAFFSATAVIRAMVEGGVPGRVVLIGSWAAHAPHPHIGGYSVAKAGLRMLGRTLALDHASDGILVNEVAPGIVDAGVSRALFAADEALRSRTIAAIPAGVTLQPADVVRDVLHLVSPDNRSTTGSVIVSDGGLSLASTMNPGSPRA